MMVKGHFCIASILLCIIDSVGRLAIGEENLLIPASHGLPTGSPYAHAVPGGRYPGQSESILTLKFQVSDYQYSEDLIYRFPENQVGAPRELLSGAEFKFSIEKRSLLRLRPGFFDKFDQRIGAGVSALAEEPYIFHRASRLVEEVVAGVIEVVGLDADGIESGTRFPERHGGQNGQRLPGGFYLTRDGGQLWQADSGSIAYHVDWTVRGQKIINEKTYADVFMGINLGRGYDPSFSPATASFGVVVHRKLKRGAIYLGSIHMKELDVNSRGPLSETADRWGLNAGYSRKFRRSIFTVDIMHSVPALEFTDGDRSPLEDPTTFLNLGILFGVKNDGSFVHYGFGDGRDFSTKDWELTATMERVIEEKHQ